MGWDIKGWLFGRDNSSDDYKKEAKQLRRDLNRQTRNFNRQYQQSVADAKVRQAAYERRTSALNAQLAQLRIDGREQALAYRNQLNQQRTQLANQRATSAEQVRNLNQLIIQNKQAYNTQAKALGQQVSAAQAAAANQARITENLGRAYVPDAQAGAVAPELSQGAVEPATRKLKDNELSSLSIVPSPSDGVIAQQLSGLQIA